MIAYPTLYLPCPLRAQEIQPVPEVVRTRMENGHVRQREEYKRHTQVYAVQWKFNRREWDFFKAWVKHELFSGTAEFTLPLPLTDQDEIVHETVKLIGGQYSANTEDQVIWVVSAQVEAENPTLTEQAVIALLTYENANGIDFIAFQEGLAENLRDDPYTLESTLNL